MVETTLSSLFPGVPFTVAGERLTLRPLILSELGAAGRVMEAWGVLVATGGQFLDADAWEDFLGLVASAVQKPRPWLDLLTEDEFEHLVCLVLAANEEVWKPDADPDTQETLPWADLLQRLVEHGHAFSTLQGYSLAQARAFLESAFRLEREALSRDIQASAFSMADGKTVADAIRELRRG